MDTALKDAVLNAMALTWKEDASEWDPTKSGRVFPGGRQINAIYAATTAGSPGRRLMVDVYVQRARSSWGSLSACQNLEKEFLDDLTKALLDERMADAGKKVAFEEFPRDESAYHHHKSGEQCPSKRRKLD